MYELSEDYKTMFANGTDKLAEYIVSHDIKSLVMGISGGIDSALCAAMASEAIFKSGRNIPLIGRSITIESNKPEEVARAKAIGEAFCTDFKELDLTDWYDDLWNDGFDIDFEVDANDFDSKVAKGNIKARMRMIQLYHLAGTNKGLVLSTDNYTELLLGFWTLHGDVGDYGMIQNLWKTEVYGIALWLADVYEEHCEATSRADALRACVAAVPTDGLGITNSDLDQLGASSYNEVDEILITHLNNKLKHDLSLSDSPVVQRYERTHFKRENPINLKREELLP